MDRDADYMAGLPRCARPTSESMTSRETRQYCIRCRGSVRDSNADCMTALERSGLRAVRVSTRWGARQHGSHVGIVTARHER